MAENSENSGEKTEKPSERQIKENLSSGQVARSRDLITALGSLLMFLFLGYSGLLSTFFTQLFRGYDDLIASADLAMYGVDTILHERFSYFPTLFLSMFAVSFLCAVASAAMTAPLFFSWKVVSPKWQRINPVEGIKKVISTKGGVEVIKALLKSSLLILVLYLLQMHYFEKVFSYHSTSILHASQFGGKVLLASAIWFSLILVLLAVPDAFWQKYSVAKDQMLTRQQAKESQKNEEGSPESKQRLRRIQRQKASVDRKKMLDSVPDADVIITNPEHFAVALQYTPEHNKAPVVIAKGVDFLAELITQKAHFSQKPVLIQPMLTRALYYHSDVGQEVAPDLYNAVARIMVYLYQLDQYRHKRLSARPKSPVINIPDKYDYLKS